MLFGIWYLERHRLSVAINLGNVCQKVDNTAGVTPLVVVPGNKLDEVLVEGDTGLDVDDGAVDVAVEIAGDNVVIGDGEDTWKEIMLACLS